MFYTVLVATLLEVVLVTGQEKYDAYVKDYFGSRVGFRIAYKRKDRTVVHHYIVPDKNTTWAQARHTCEQKSGFKLATFEDYVELRHLSSEYHRLYCTECNGMYWVGDRYHENNRDICNAIFLKRSELVGFNCNYEPQPKSRSPLDIKGYVCTTMMKP
ncbi:hypothetical protein Y032_0596g435 [Ancylostoma ceylanicum]|nr:hypothetical protein Y032_0596g435 [Ancylostoma ceylanicum]